MSFTTFITPAELEMNLNDPDWVIVDCRFDLMKPDWGYAAYQAAHIPRRFMRTWIMIYPDH